MKREQITEAVLERMRTIKTSNGYNTNVGTNAEINRTDPMGEGESYLIDIVAGSWETQDQSNYVRRWMNISIAFACSGDNAIDSRDNIIADVVKAVYVDTTWGGLAILTEETGGASDKDVAQQIYAWGEVDLRILYDTVEGEI